MIVFEDWVDESKSVTHRRWIEIERAFLAGPAVVLAACAGGRLKVELLACA